MTRQAATFFDLSFDSFRSWWWPWYTTAIQQQSLLRLIAVATEENLPLAPLLAAWAEDERGVQRRRVLRLVRLLESGRSLADAVEDVPGVLRDEDVLAIRFDVQTGTRTAAVRQKLGETNGVSPGVMSRTRRSLVYFCTVVPLGLLVLTFTQLKIVPVLAKIFSDFGLQPPSGLEWSVENGGLFPADWWVAGLAVMAVVLWMFTTRKGRHVRHRLFGRLFRPLYQLRSADVLQKIGVAVSAGRPIPGALSTLARYHFDPALRQELLFVRNEVEQGVEVWQSMTAVGLLSPAEAHLLRTSERLGNRPWVLKQLVGAKQRRTVRRLERGAEFTLPVVVLLMTGLVIFEALIVFVPLMTLVEALL